MKQSQVSLETEVDLLRRRVVELESQLVKPDAESLYRRLGERVKELSTLYRESYLADQRRSSLDDYFTELVALLPLGWQYPGDACARILVNGQTYATPNFTASPWQQSSKIVVQGKEIGMITVGYVALHPQNDEGPFLVEERSLINEIAKRAGHYIERSQSETARRFLSAIVESSDNAIISMTLDGVIQTWNAAAQQIYGYAARDVIGKSIAAILTPEQHEEILHLLQRTRDGYRIENFETSRRRKDGNEIFVAISFYPIRDDQGGTVGATAIARDISELRQFEATMRESDERLRYTFEQAAVGLAHISLDGRFLRVNQKLCTILGYSPAELMAMTVQQLTHPDDLTVEMDYIRSMLAGERLTHYSLEQRNYRKDQTSVWVNYTVSLALDHSSRPKYFIAVVEDISQRKEAERARMESEARYRDLFENSPISLWEQDFSGVKRMIATLHGGGVTDFRAYFERHTDMVQQCLAQVKLLSFNRASLDLYGAADREELLSNLDRFMPEEGYPLFIEELVWIAEGRTNFSWEGVNRKLSGEHIFIRLHWSAAPGHEEKLDRVLVSIEDISRENQAATPAL